MIRAAAVAVVNLLARFADKTITAWPNLTDRAPICPSCKQPHCTHQETR